MRSFVDCLFSEFLLIVCEHSSLNSRWCVLRIIVCLMMMQDFAIQVIVIICSRLLTVYLNICDYFE